MVWVFTNMIVLFGLEIVLFFELGSMFGSSFVLLWAFLSAFIGLWLMRSCGLAFFKTTYQVFHLNSDLVYKAFYSLVFYIAAVMLIVPGFFTDSIGLILFIPQTRSFISSIVMRYILPHLFTTAPHYDNKQRAAGIVIDPEFHEITSEQHEERTHNNNNRPMSSKDIINPEDNH